MVDLWFLQGKWLPQATPSGQQTAPVATVGKDTAGTTAKVWLVPKFNFGWIAWVNKPAIGSDLPTQQPIQQNIQQLPQNQSNLGVSWQQVDITTTKWLSQASSQPIQQSELTKQLNKTQFNEFPSDVKAKIKLDIQQPPAIDGILPPTDPNKMDISAFAEKIKFQYPEYNNMDNIELATKYLNKTYKTNPELYQKYLSVVDTPLGSQKPISDFTQKIEDYTLEHIKILENHIHMSEQQLAQLTPEQRAKFDSNGDYESGWVYNPAAMIWYGIAKFVNNVAWWAETAIRGTTSLTDRAGKGIAEWMVSKMSPSTIESIKQFNRDNPELYKVAKAYTDMWGMQVTTRDAIADVANWVTTAAVALMPKGAIILNIASVTPWTKEALGFAINKVVSPSLLWAINWVGDKLFNWAFTSFRDSLTPDRQQQRDMTVWTTWLAMILWGKYRDPKTGKLSLKTVVSNLDPRILVPNFEQALFNTTTSVSRAIQSIWAPKLDDMWKIDITEPTGKVTTLDRIIANKIGMDAENIRFMKDNPILIKAIDDGSLNKEWFKKEIVKVIDNMKNDTSTIGKLYQEAYKQTRTFDTAPIIKEMQNNLKDKGVVFDAENKIIGFDTTNPYAANIKIAEQWVIKRMYNQTVSSIKDKTDLTVQQTHASRIALYKASYSEWVSTKASPTLRALSSVFDDRLKTVDGFAKIDADYKASISDLNAISKLVLNRQWEFKWTLKAMLGEAQYKKLQALEEVMPWATKRLEAIKAWDDYIRARETHKVWFYSSISNHLTSWWIWWILGWATWWPIGAVLGSILVELVSAKITDPEVFKNWIIKNIPKWEDMVVKINNNEPLLESEQKVILAKLKEKWVQDAYNYAREKWVWADESLKMIQEAKKTVIPKNTTIDKWTLKEWPWAYNEPWLSKVESNKITIKPWVETPKVEEPIIVYRWFNKWSSWEGGTRMWEWKYYTTDYNTAKTYWNNINEIKISNNKFLDASWNNKELLKYIQEETKWRMIPYWEVTTDKFIAQYSDSKLLRNLIQEYAKKNWYDWIKHTFESSPWIKDIKNWRQWIHYVIFPTSKWLPINESIPQMKVTLKWDTDLSKTKWLKEKIPTIEWSDWTIVKNIKVWWYNAKEYTTLNNKATGTILKTIEISDWKSEVWNINYDTTPWKQLTISAIEIFPKYRGKGIAKELVTNVEKYAKVNWLSEVNVHWVTNRSFWEALWYKRKITPFQWFKDMTIESSTEYVKKL